jgi:hypothetical protein
MTTYPWQAPPPQSIYDDPAGHNAAKRLVTYAFKHQPSPIMAMSDAINLCLMAAGRAQLMTEPSMDFLASMIARTILFCIWFPDQETALQFVAGVARHLFVYQHADKRMMGNKGGRA